MKPLTIWHRLLGTVPDQPKPTRKPRQRRAEPIEASVRSAERTILLELGRASTNHHERISELEQGLEALRAQVRNLSGKE